MEKDELSWAEIKAMWGETDRRIEENDRKWAEKWAGITRGFEETKQLFDKLGIKADNINTKVEGISKSNGLFAEEYFFSSLEEKKEFAGIHFDTVSNSFRTSRKMPDGSKIEDQFDVVMINSKAVAIIEIKYKADSDDIIELAERKAKNFKTLFPVYKDFDIYLGLGSFNFNEYVVKEAKEYGIGLLKQVGNSIECKNDWAMKAY
jgi:hypothetical protein